MANRDPYKFERDVAALYRRLGAQVKHDVSLAGNQIDVVVTDTTSTGGAVVTVVECKAYASAVGINQIRTFGIVVSLLRERGLAQAAAVVSASGFTRTARQLADEIRIDLVEFDELAARASAVAPSPTASTSAPPAPSAAVTDAGGTPQRRAFAAMPFTERYDDVYILGIQPAAEDAGMVAERADDNLASTEIVDYMKAKIAESDIVIVDTTKKNANVFYELGYADGLGKQVILVAKAGTKLPFDIQGRSHILYPSIRELREALTGILRRL